MNRTTSGPPKVDRSCFRCGQPGHVATHCRYPQDIVCRHCGKTGHMKVCRNASSSTSSSKKALEQKPVRQIRELEEDTITSPLFQVTSTRGSPPLLVELVMDEVEVSMELDTGATMSIMPEQLFRQLFPGRDIPVTSVRLCGYNQDPIPVVGSCDVTVKYKGQTTKVPLLIVGSSGPALLGRNWLDKLVLDWKAICSVSTGGDTLQSLLDSHADVFSEGLGTLKGFHAAIRIDPKAQPRFCKPRVVPYAYREKVNAELDRLVKEGTLEPVEVAEWAAPIVPVVKRNKSSIRICGDFCMTVNPVSKLDAYPIPKVEDLFAQLTKGKLFSKIDLTQAYQQLPLDERSKELVAINTQKGLFRFTRLPFGVSSAPGIFQRVMESVLQGIPQVAVYLDDILITGSSEQEHLATLAKVLSRLDKAGLKVKREKCEFMK